MGEKISRAEKKDGPNRSELKPQQDRREAVRDAVGKLAMKGATKK